MLKEERESIAINSMCESKRETGKDNSTDGRKRFKHEKSLYFIMYVICECAANQKFGDGEDSCVKTTHSLTEKERKFPKKRKK